MSTEQKIRLCLPRNKRKVFKVFKFSSYALFISPRFSYTAGGFVWCGAILPSKLAPGEVGV